MGSEASNVEEWTRRQIETQPMAITQSLHGEPPEHGRRHDPPDPIMEEEERLLVRRREINRNSQKRSRERKAKELEEWREKFMQVAFEKDCIVEEKAELSKKYEKLSKKYEELMEKWHQTISDNAILNQEILTLKAKIKKRGRITSGGEKQTTSCQE